MVATTTTLSSVGYTAKNPLPPSSEHVPPPSMDALTYWEMTSSKYEKEPDDVEYYAELCACLNLDTLYPERAMPPPPLDYLEDVAPVATMDNTAQVPSGPSKEPNSSPTGIPNPLAQTLVPSIQPSEEKINIPNPLADTVVPTRASPEQNYFSSTTSFVVSPSTSPYASADDASTSTSPTETLDVDDTSEMTRPKKKQRRTYKKNTKNTLTISEDELELARRLRNREHARKSRLRKKMAGRSLEATIPQLREENERLRNEAYALIGKESTDRAVQENLIRPQKRLVENLKKAEHRIVDKATLEFLQSLSKNTLAATPEESRLVVG